MSNIDATQYKLRFIGSKPINANNVISTYSRYLGQRQYELSNHLGNVLATVADYKTAATNGASYMAALSSVQDYYPFGMQMPGRNYTHPLPTTSKYRFGFNGKEMDDEVKGKGNWQDYGMRMYDPRLARFPNVDPLTAKYPFYTPYQFAGNMPIRYIDLDGLEPAEPGTYKGQGAIAAQTDECGDKCEGTDNYRWTWKNDMWSHTNFNVTNGELTAIFENGKPNALKQIEITVNLEGVKFGIKSKKSLAHFLSQAGHEVGGFTKGLDLEENLNYSVDGLIDIFGKYFYKGVAVAGKYDATKYGRIATKGKVTQVADQIGIANIAYANRMGNGDVTSGDGSKFKGRGIFQLTGRSNYTAFNTFLNQSGVDIVGNPTLIATSTEYSIKSAMWYFKTEVVDKLNIEKTSVESVTKKVNGGSTGLSEREEIYNKAIQNLK